MLGLLSSSSTSLTHPVYFKRNVNWDSHLRQRRVVSHSNSSNVSPTISGSFWLRILACIEGFLMIGICLVVVT